MNLNKRYLIYLALIILISLTFKLYTVDFSIPVTSDAVEYALLAVAYSNGQFLQHPQYNSGWPLLISSFFLAVNSENFLDYSNVMRILGLGISTITILLVYLVSRKFFNEKLSIMAAIIFAFEPRLNQISGLGVSEPLFILIMISSFYFILNTNTRYLFVSFILAGILWWVRPNGFMMFFALSIIYFINFRKTKNFVRTYVFYVLLLLLIVSPMLLQRYDQFGNPTYNWIAEKIWVGDYAQSISVNIQSADYTALDFINDNGILSFFNKFVLAGLYNLLYITARMTFPYLFVLLPFGIFLSFKMVFRDNNIRALWITILVTIVSMIVSFSVIPDKRLMFFLFPFLSIFATLPIKKLIEHKSDKIFSINIKNILLVIVGVSVIIVSALYTSYYERPDSILEKEKLEFTTYMVYDIKAKVLFDPSDLQNYFGHPLIFSDPSYFKKIRINENWENGKPVFNYPEETHNRIMIHGKSMEDLISNGEKYGLTHIMTTKDGGSFFSFVDELYSEEKKYAYLKKVFDSNEQRFTKLNLKVFEIDYGKFHQLFG